MLESFLFPVNCDSKQKKTPFQSHDDTACSGGETPSMILRAIDNTSKIITTKCHLQGRRIVMFYANIDIMAAR